MELAREPLDSERSISPKMVQFAVSGTDSVMHRHGGRTTYIGFNESRRVGSWIFDSISSLGDGSRIELTC